MELKLEGVKMCNANHDLYKREQKAKEYSRKVEEQMENDHSFATELLIALAGLMVFVTIIL